MSSARTFGAPATALVRDVSARFDRCLREHAEPPIDLDRARAQHAGYVATLRKLGVAIEAVPPNDAHADGCFVEDTAVVTGAHAVMTIPGAPSRRAEGVEVRQTLSRLRTPNEMEGDARLDGGDVLRVNDLLLVGLSSRTNEAGASALARVAAEDGLETRTVPLAAGLHLKSVVTLVDPSTLVMAPGLPRDLIEAIRSPGVELVEADEPVGANVLAVGDVVLASAGAPKTAARLRARGTTVVDLDVSEFHLADGALTCLSIRIPPPGGWCA